MPLDYTPLILRLAEEASSLEELARLAVENGFVAYETVIELPRRIDGLGSRVHGLAVYAGARLAGFAVEGDGGDPRAYAELSRLLGAPVIVVERVGEEAAA